MKKRNRNAAKLIMKQRYRNIRSKREMHLGVLELIYLAILIILAMVACSGCQAIKPSWQGLFIGTQIIEPFSTAPRYRDISSEATAIIGLSQRDSLHIGVYGNRDEQGWRIAIEHKLF